MSGLRSSSVTSYLNSWRILLSTSTLVFEFILGDARNYFCCLLDSTLNCIFSCLLRASWKRRVDISTFRIIDFDRFSILGLNIDASAENYPNYYSPWVLSVTYLLFRLPFISLLLLWSALWLFEWWGTSMFSSLFISCLNLLIFCSLLERYDYFSLGAVLAKFVYILLAMLV